MKTIIIDKKEYDIECNAFTYVKYKQIFNVGIFEDIQKIQTFTMMQSINKEQLLKENPAMTNEEVGAMLGQLMTSNIDEFIIAITRVAWITIYSANNKIEEYEKWLKSITNFSVDDEWVVEVAKFVADCFYQ